MNCITIFLKNRQRKELSKKIHNLEIQSASFLGKATSAKINANSILNYVKLQQKQAEHGDELATVWLSCYLSEYLKEYQDYLESATTNYQHYKNLQNQINFLNKEFSKLDD